MINILSKETIDKIAAGEVVERPESVVKELLENAVDSGASGISVEIREGGLSLIRVTDNGCGIAKEDIPLAFLRHATSKLKEASDLFHIRTMGFRGEALASISGVSEVEMITKRASDLLGYRYEISGGVEKSLQEIGAPDGTTLVVRNLFYNVPARKKFLRSASSEGSRIADITEKTALAHPDISFRLTADGRSLLHTSGNGRLKDVIFSIYGREIAENLIELPKAGETELRSAAGAERTQTGDTQTKAFPQSEIASVCVGGFIGKPVIARSKRDFEVYFVNGRYVKSSVIEKAIEEAFRPFMMLHKFPFTMLVLSVDPERVDVNVHPKKMEVRFSDSEAVYNAVFRAVSEALSKKELIVEITPGKEQMQRPSRGVSSLPVSKEEPAEPFEQKKNAAELAKLGVSMLPRAPQGSLAMPELKQGGGQQVADAPEVSYGGVPLNHAASGQVFDRGGTAPAAAETPAKHDAENNAAAGQIPRLASETTGLKSVVNKSAEEQQFTKAAEKQETAAGNPFAAAAAQNCEQAELLQSEKFLSENAVPFFRMIGQLFETYWLIEFSDKLYIIDQHAAHEKVNYERTMRLLREKKLESQMILPPIRLSLNAGEALLLEKYMQSFTELGYEIEADGDREFLVRAVPANLYSIADRELLMELLDGLSEERGRAVTPDILRDRVASMSCKAAVKGNNYLSEEEMKALIGELLTLENPYACPHGRPTIISMSRYELDRKFKRIV